MGWNPIIYIMGDKVLLLTYFWGHINPRFIMQIHYIKLLTLFDWWVITSKKLQQFEIDKVWKSARQVSHDYAAGNILYVDMAVIYIKVYYKECGPYNNIIFLQMVQFKSIRVK